MGAGVRERCQHGQESGLSAVCLGDKEQPREDEAVVEICRCPPNLAYREQAVCLPSQKKQSPIWTVAFFINQNQSLLMHGGPSMLHRAPFSAL